MTVDATLRHYTAVRADWRTLVLAALFAIVIAGALSVRPTLVADGSVQSATTGTTAGQQATAGVAWAVIEAVFAGILLGALLLWRRLPEWIQDVAFDALTIAVWMTVGAWALANDQFAIAVPVIVGLYAIAKITDRIDVWWAINDLIALAAAMYLAAIVGVVLGPIVIGVGLVGLAVYDHVFANQQSWMFELAEWTIRRKLPLLVVIPTTLRQSWAELAEEGDITEDDTTFAIGMPDLLLPAAFAVALAHTGHLTPLYGAVAGTFVACFRLSWIMNSGDGGAGLPAITTGAVAGAVIGMGVA